MPKSSTASRTPTAASSRSTGSRRASTIAADSVISTLTRSGSTPVGLQARAQRSGEVAGCAAGGARR